MLRKLLLLLLCLGGIAAITAWQLHSRWQQPLSITGDSYYLFIAPGATLTQVAAQLREDNVYREDWLLRLYGRYTRLDQKVRHGEYAVAAGTTPEQFLALVTSGKVIHYQVTLPEGITLARALSLLAETPELKSVLKGADDPRILQMVAPRTVAEGLFFPDSYRFVRGTTDLDILRRAHEAMVTILDREWQQRSPGLPYETAYEALIMASIIERETGLEHERDEIAGVFVRRLQRKMRLQTDPTVIYGLGESFDGNLRRVHLRDAGNPYNTYRHAGLPPSPIALPGQAAIHAALNPKEGTALFFVARGDGGHYFSDTLAEHEQAVRKYQLQRRQDYRSAPQEAQ